jgi:hypothetical protein
MGRPGLEAHTHTYSNTKGYVVVVVVVVVVVNLCIFGIRNTWMKER